jgi:ATP-dependent DNA helicase RecQ
LSGKIPATEAAGEGRALSRLTDIGWGTRLRTLLAAEDAEIPEDVFAACVQVLAAWQWQERPVGVVTITSTRHQKLITSLGNRLAAVGRLPTLGQVAVDAGPGHPANSARRVAQLWPAMRALADMSTVDGPVLLVDDLLDSGWTMTLAARLVRRAGVPAVLPFTLATTA